MSLPKSKDGEKLVIQHMKSENIQNTYYAIQTQTNLNQIFYGQLFFFLFLRILKND